MKGKFIDLEYPRSEDREKFIQVGLMDVRAADDIRISYDFDRDGWVIQQHPCEDDDGNYIDVGDWQEVAFIQAWGLMRDG